MAWKNLTEDVAEMFGQLEGCLDDTDLRSLTTGIGDGRTRADEAKRVAEYRARMTPSAVARAKEVRRARREHENALQRARYAAKKEQAA